MVKKIITLSTLIFGITGITNIATATSPPSTYWTLDELAILAEEVKQNSTCEDDFCREMELWNLRQTDDKYKALSESMAIPLKITSFNPSKGTITIRYSTENDRLKNLHIARFDVGGPDYDFNEAARDSLPLKPGTRLAVSEKEADNGENWFPSNQDVTFQMIDATFGDNIAPVFWFFFDTPNTDWGWGGQYHFKECLESPDYHEGMECRLAYTKERPLYIPAEPKPEPIIPEPTVPEAITPAIPEPTIPEPITPEPVVFGPAISESIVATASLTPQSASRPTPNLVAPLVATTQVAQIPQNPDEIEIPNLGDTCRKERTIVFPWWLIVLILIGNAVILWLFWPKNPKKYQKTIDKSINL